MEGRDWLERIRSTLGMGEKEQVSPEWPEWYADYRRAFAPPSEDTPLTEAEFRVIDAEATGLDPTSDRMLSLGGLPLRGNSIDLSGQFERYARVGEQSGYGKSVPIHGIIPNSRRYRYEGEPEILAALLGFLGSCPIVGHHIGFDLELINRALVRAGAGRLLNPVIDTGLLAKRLRPPGYWAPPEDYTLDTLARRYRISLSDRHTALGDSYITALLFLKLTAKLATRRKRELRLGDL